METTRARLASQRTSRMASQRRIAPAEVTLVTMTSAWTSELLDSLGIARFDMMQPWR